MFSTDLYFRECWVDFAEIFGAKTEQALQSLTLLSLKPDAVVGRRAEAIVDYVASRGFCPVATIPVSLNRHSIRELWRYDWNAFPVDRIEFSTLWYTSTDVLVFILEDLQAADGTPASGRLSPMKGGPDARLRAPDSLRTLLRPPNRILNFVHMADEPGDLVRELGIFFDRETRRELLTCIAGRMGSSWIGEARSEIATLEARYPGHDLDLTASIQRLQDSGATNPRIIQQMMAQMNRGEPASWPQLISQVDPFASNVSRWDFIVLSTHLMQAERPVPSPGDPASKY
ncbi:nucleoside diphosphate kinase [Mesorhizobium sp. LSHC414A00]|nr:nucleoside diphosphate kinase [Mesorhizobium sp. LSHC414A00]